MFNAILLAGWVPHGLADNWEDIRNQASKIKSFKARFMQKKQMKLLRKPLVSKGFFYYKAPRSLRWEYTSPIESVLLLHQGKIRRFFKRDDAFIEDYAVNLPALQMVMEEITEWFQGRFAENPDFTAALKPEGKIVLTPNKKALAKVIIRVELVLAKKQGFIESISIFESEHSYTELKFIETKLNLELKDTIFQGM